jgi:NAD-dependent deacetylase
MDTPQILSSVTPELRERFHKAYSIAVFSGAGISASSGVPTFRGANQMKYFDGYPPFYICSTEMFERSPEICWRFFHHMYDLVNQAEPNIAHQTLTLWEKEATRRRVVRLYMITSNFDGLLLRAGGTAFELHGNINRAVCRLCKQAYPMQEVGYSSEPRCSCSGLLQPDIALLNDYVNEDAYKEGITATRGCEIFIVIGTSGVHRHCMGFTQMVKARPSSLLIEVNSRPSYLSKYMNVVLRGCAEEILPQFEYGTA